MKLDDVIDKLYELTALIKEHATLQHLWLCGGLMGIPTWGLLLGIFGMAVQFVGLFLLFYAGYLMLQKRKTLLDKLFDKKS